MSTTLSCALGIILYKLRIERVADWGKSASFLLFWHEDVILCPMDPHIYAEPLTIGFGMIEM